MTACAFISAVPRKSGGGGDVIGSVLCAMTGVGIFIGFVMYARAAPGHHRFGFQHIEEGIPLVTAVRSIDVARLGLRNPGWAFRAR